MSVKSKITVLAFIIYISLICVGFASWTLTADTKDVFVDNNVVTSETIINTSDEITVGNVKNFKYFNNGFINETDNTLCYTAKVSVELTINKDKCAEVTAELKINDLISGLVFDSITCVIEGSTDTLEYGSKVTIDTTKMETNTVTLIYTLTTNKDTFITNVYTPLYNNSDKNIFSIELNVSKEKISQ